MKKKLRNLKQTTSYLFLGLSFAFFTNLINAQTTTTLDVTDDTYVWLYANGGTNYDGGNFLISKLNSSGNLNHRIPFIKFDASGFAGTTITSATLRLYQSGTTTHERGIYFFDGADEATDDMWTEETLTGNTVPSFGDPLDDYLDDSDINFTVVSGDWTEIDLTSYVQSQIDGGDTTISLVIHTNTPRSDAGGSGNTVNFHSKESATDSDKAAQLVIVTNPLSVEDESIVISTHPNPVSDKLSVSLANSNLNINNTVVNLYSINGLRVKTKSISAIDFDMNLSDLSSGVYILSIADESRAISKKIVIE